MNSLHKLIRDTALMLSLACLLAFAGCQRQPVAAIPSKITKTSSDMPPESVLSDLQSSEPPNEAISSEQTPVSSKEKPTSSQTVEASSQASPPAIPFTVGAVDKEIGIPLGANFSDFNNTFGAIVIRSAAEYRERFDPDNTLIPSDADTGSFYRSKLCDYLSKYNETFFEENALIYMVTHHAQSCSLNDYIHSLVRYGNQLTIEYTTAVTDDPDSNQVYYTLPSSGGRKTLIEVKKSDVEGVTEIVPQQSGEDTPPTWWF